MNISSIVVQTKPEHLNEIIATLKASELCDYHLHDELGRIIVTLEGENISEEIAKLRAIQALPNIISAEMHYAYSEDELEEARKNIENADIMPEWINDPNADISKIDYKGDLRGKF